MEPEAPAGVPGSEFIALAPVPAPGGNLGLGASTNGAKHDNGQHENGAPRNGAPYLATLMASAPAPSESPTARGLLPPLNGVPTPEEIRAILEARGGHPSRLHPFWWLATGVVSCAVILLATFAVVRRSDAWDQEHRGAIVDLKNRAEALAGAGKLGEAHQAFIDLDKLIGGRALRDPELKRLVDEAHSEQAKVYQRRMAEPAAVPSSLPPAPLAGGPPVAPAFLPGDLRNPAPNPAPAPAPSMGQASGSSPEGGTAAAAHPALATRPADPAPAGTATAAPAPAPRPGYARPVPRPIPDDPDVLTDARIGQSIQAGVNYLLARFDSVRHTLRGGRDDDDAYYCGEDALAVYALLQCGEAVNDPRLNVRGSDMKALIDAMKKLPVDSTYQTYARAIRAAALALFDRPEDYAALSADARWLIATCDAGAYTYSNRLLHPLSKLYENWHEGPPGGAWDNSNSQYGLLGVWSAVEAEPRIEVPAAYWKAVEGHWTECQIKNGEWGYTHGGGKLSMTCAGLASLFVTHEYLEPAMSGAVRNPGDHPLTAEPIPAPVGREPFTPALKKGLDWFEEEDHAISVDGGHWGYNLYGVERVGLASGFKYFGSHDWYRELAARAVESQNRNGSWGQGVIDTSYALLFLARGRHPILMNKLRFDGYWANRPRDAAHLARYAGRQLERPINWQIVNVKRPWTDWTDSPILYLSSHQAPQLTDEDVDRVREFVRAGGLLFTNADAGSAAFNAFATDLARKLFKDYEMADLPPGHLIYTINFKPDPRPPLKYVTNGARVLMVHSPTDLATHWQKREDRPWENGAEGKNEPALRARQLAPFQLGANLFIYAAGKRDLRNRLEASWVSPAAAEPLATIKVARLRYAGNWDPEPFAWTRYANWFQRQTGYKLDVQAVPLKDLKPDDAAVAHLTGTARYAFSAEETAAAKAYVEAGGVLLIDMCGGTGAFDQTLTGTLLNPAFPDRFPSAVGSAHPLVNTGAPGMEDLSRARLRPFAVERRGHINGMPSILAFGKGHVLATNLDLTCGLLNTDTWGILGYDPAYAQSLVKNILFWAIDGQADK